MKLENSTLTFIGQAGFILKNNKGKTLAVDLYLSKCAERIYGSPGFKRLTPTILGFYDIIFDYLIATHPHADHFDFDAIPCLMDNETTHLFASVKCAELIHKRNMSEERVTYVTSGDYYEDDEFKIEFVTCDHGEDAPDAVGIIINMDGKRIFMTGDTCLREDCSHEYLKQGPLDILIGPINGAYGNMNEDEFVKLTILLNPQLVIPCHYGMFAAHGGNPGKFMNIMDNKNIDIKYHIMSLGESLFI